MSNSTITKIYHDLLGQANTEPLSQVMPKALWLARELNLPDFEKWLRLETGGYFHFNAALTEDDRVPDYRSIVVQHTKFGTPYVFTPELNYVNNYWLRDGVGALENLATGEGQMLSIQDPALNDFFRKKLELEVSDSRFSREAVRSVLISIRYELIEWLHRIKGSSHELSVDSEEDNAYLDDKRSVQISVTNGSTIGSMVIGSSLENSFNTIVSNGAVERLETLKEAVEAMVKVMPSETAEQVTRDLEILTAELTSKSPRKKWCQLSADGLIKAAKNIGEIGVPVCKIVAEIIAMIPK